MTFLNPHRLVLSLRYYMVVWKMMNLQPFFHHIQLAELPHYLKQYSKAIPF